MKPINLLLTATAFVLFSTSCSHQQTEAPARLDPLVELWTGEDSLYTPENNLQAATVTVEDGAVMNAAVQNGKVLLKAAVGGNTIVTITGTDNRKASIRARSLTPFYMWRNLVNHATYKPQVTVNVTDAVVKAAITAELLAKVAKPYYLQFNDKDSARYRDESGAQPVMAAVKFENLKFTLTLNGATTHYTVLTHKDRYILGLVNNLTAHYQALYPGKGIESVVTVEYVQQQLPPG